MINGLIIEVKGEELIEYASVRAAHHLQRAKECDMQLKESSRRRPTAKAQEPVVAGLVEPTSKALLMRKARQHRERADALTFFGKHLVRDEVYHVTETDLCAADLLPDRSPMGDWLW